jgi:hypothetical protein
LTKLPLVARDELTVSLMGGLGNQLFQYSFARALSSHRQVPVKLDVSWYRHRFRRKPNGLVLREYSLGGLVPESELLAPTTNVGALWSHAWEFGTRKLAQRRGGPVASRYVEHGPEFDSSALSDLRYRSFWGYFASWKYFDSCQAAIRSEILDWVSNDPWARENAAEAGAQGPVGLHVRRGDYVALSRLYGSLGAGYYESAIETVRQSGHSGPIWLFSDDPAGAVEALGGRLPIARVVDSQAKASAAGTLAVMARLGALIMANSTFSWWGAYLGDRPERPVVTPALHLRAQGVPQSEDFYLPHWRAAELT